MGSKKCLCRLKVASPQGHHPELPPFYVSSKSATDWLRFAGENCAGTLFQCKYRMHLHNSKPGDEASASRLLDNSLRKFTADLSVVKFGDRAGVEKNAQRQSTPGVPLRTDVVGEIAGYLRQDMAHFLQRRLDFLAALNGSHVLVIEPGVSPVVGRIGNGHSDQLMFLQREGFQWPKHSVFIHRRERLHHMSSIIPPFDY
jgi:hypothetical protein